MYEKRKYSGKRSNVLRHRIKYQRKVRSVVEYKYDRLGEEAKWFVETLHRSKNLSFQNLHFKVKVNVVLDFRKALIN